MARRKKVQGGSIASYFKGVFGEHPEWLTSQSNADIIERYNADHPSKPADARIKANLANIKSTMKRDKRRGKVSKARLGRPPAAAAAAAATLEDSAPNVLETLEIAIDDCLIMAKNIDRRGLDKVIDHLRHARNLVVWKSGQ